jgi:hypothetical protein
MIERDKKKRLRSFSYGVGFGGVLVVLLSVWMFRQYSISKGASFIMLWGGIAFFIVAITTLITTYIE